MTSTNHQKEDGLWTAGFGEIGATLKALQDHGVTLTHLAKLRAEQDFAKRAADALIHHGLRTPVLYLHKKVSDMLGKNFFGVEDWAFHYGVNFTLDQLRRIEHFPWNEKTLESPCPFTKGKKIRETHFAFLGLEGMNNTFLTLENFLQLNTDLITPSDLENSNEHAKEVKGETCQFRWYLMSLNRAYSDRGGKEFSKLPYEVPVAIEEAMRVILYFRKNGICLDGGCCASPDPNDESGHIHPCWHNENFFLNYHYVKLFGGRSGCYVAPSRLPGQ